MAFLHLNYPLLLIIHYPLLFIVVAASSGTQPSFKDSCNHSWFCFNLLSCNYHHRVSHVQENTSQRENRYSFSLANCSPVCLHCDSSRLTACIYKRLCKFFLTIQEVGHYCDTIDLQWHFDLTYNIYS